MNLSGQISAGLIPENRDPGSHHMQHWELGAAKTSLRDALGSRVVGINLGGKTLTGHTTGRTSGFKRVREYKEAEEFS